MIDENMTDEEFEAAMNAAINNPDAAETAVVDEEVTVDDAAEVAETEDTPEDNDAGTEDGVEDEIESDESEQPGMDSVETADDDETVEDDEEEPSDTADEADETADEVIEDNPTTEDDTQVTSEDDAQKEEKIEKYKLKAAGSEYELTIDEMRSMAAKGFDYTAKTQELKPWRTAISKLKEAELGETDIDMMIDVLKGNKEATTALLKRTGVDALELDMEQEQTYTPNTYGKSNVELDIQEVFNEIDRDPEAQITRHVIGNQWDDASRDKMVSGITLGNGSTLSGQDIMRGLHDDIKSGEYDKVSPIANKLKALDGGRKSDIEYYMDAGTQYYADMRVNEQREAALKAQAEEKVKLEADKIAEAKALKAKIAADKKAAAKRKAAAPTKSRAGTNDVIDYLDMDSMSDEEFSAMMEKQIK